MESPVEGLAQVTSQAETADTAPGFAEMTGNGAVKLPGRKCTYKNTFRFISPLLC